LNVRIKITIIILPIIIKILLIIACTPTPPKNPERKPKVQKKNILTKKYSSITSHSRISPSQIKPSTKDKKNTHRHKKSQTEQKQRAASVVALVAPLSTSMTPLT